MNFFDALHVPFDCAARDIRSAMQRLSSLVARPVQTLTNRAFESTQVARIANSSLTSEELAPLDKWRADPEGNISDRSIRLMLGLR